MPSPGQATSSADNVKLIIDALADYAKETGIDLSKNPFAAKFEQSRSPDAILQLLEEREKAFKEYRDGKRRLINCLNPAVTVLHRFSGILSGAAGLVSRTYHLVGHLTDPVRLPSFQQAFCLLVWILSLAYVARIFLPKLLSDIEHARPPVRFHQAMTPSRISLSIWGVSSSVWTSIQRSTLHR